MTVLGEEKRGRIYFLKIDPSPFPLNPITENLSLVGRSVANVIRNREKRIFLSI